MTAGALTAVPLSKTVFLYRLWSFYWRRHRLISSDFYCTSDSEFTLCGCLLDLLYDIQQWPCSIRSVPKKQMISRVIDQKVFSCVFIIGKAYGIQSRLAGSSSCPLPRNCCLLLLRERISSRACCLVSHPEGNCSVYVLFSPAAGMQCALNAASLSWGMCKSKCLEMKNP